MRREKKDTGEGAKQKKDARWGRALQPGYTQVPNVLIEKLGALSIQPLDFCIIVFLMKYW